MAFANSLGKYFELYVAAEANSLLVNAEGGPDRNNDASENKKRDASEKRPPSKLVQQGA
jgi:hypothetical protein